jgi:hypothetical protein
MDKLAGDLAARAAREAAWLFATGRLGDQAVIEWALSLPSTSETEREVLRELFRREADRLNKVHRDAWEWIVASWAHAPRVDTGQLYYRKRLRPETLSIDDIVTLVDSVAPIVSVESHDRLDRLYGNVRPSTPRSARDIVHVTISSHEVHHPEALAVVRRVESAVLVQICLTLYARLAAALLQASQIGLIDGDDDITVWQVRRVYFVPDAQHPEGGHEPDLHSRGFALAAKLVHECLSLISRSNSQFVTGMMDVLKSQDFSLLRRLWAALARDAALGEGATVATFLQGLSDREFWLLGAYPEHAELRAVRWNSFPDDLRVELEKRLRAGRPLSLIGGALPAEDRRNQSVRAAIVEFHRIQAGGGVLSAATIKWLSSRSVADLPNLKQVTDGFNPGVIVTWGREETAQQTFRATRRDRILSALERAIDDDYWSDSTRGATDYVTTNMSAIIELLKLQRDGGGRYPKLWNIIGHNHKPTDGATVRAGQSAEAKMLAAMIKLLPHSALTVAASGLSEWLSTWAKLLAKDDMLSAPWLHLWETAVDVTNATGEPEDVELAALNSPAGKMMSAFLDACPALHGGSDPFDGSSLGQMREALSNVSGWAREQVRYRLIRDIRYFFIASPEWTRANLITHLAQSTTASDWEAFSRGKLPPAAAIAPLADQLAWAVISSEFDQSLRSSLMANAIWHVLVSVEGGVQPAITDDLIQQMLRIGGDAVRIGAIESFTSFLQQGAADGFNVVAAVFNRVWPKELTLGSKGLSQALIEIPALAKGHYREGVELILPYVSAFDCWSLWDFRIWEDPTSEEKRSVIKTEDDGLALLALLDRSISGEDGAVIPHDLEQGLRAITEKAKMAAKDPRYQRLLTLARR